VDLAGHGLADLRLGEPLLVDQHLAELAPAAALLVQGLVKLDGADQAFLNQQVTEPEFLWARHGGVLRG